MSNAVGGAGRSSRPDEIESSHEETGERRIALHSEPVGAGGQARARIDVTLIQGDVIDARIHGYLTHALLRDAHRRMEALVRAHAPVLLLRDVLAMDGFEPGVPIAAVRWVEQFEGQIKRAAWVVRSSTVASVARTFEILIPGMPQMLCATRSEALAYLKGK